MTGKSDKTKTAEDTRPVIEHHGKEKRVNLTQEQAGTIVFNGIYKADPESFRDYEYISRYWPTSGKYHCRNWCFYVSIDCDGDVWLVDTYWSSSSDTRFLVKSDEFDKMMGRVELIMDDKENYRSVSDEQAKRYDPSDIVKAAFGSGGWTYSSTKWVRKDAKPVALRELSISLNKAKSELRNLFNTYDAASALRNLENDIEKVKKAGLAFDDADDVKKRDEVIASIKTETTTLGSLGKGDFARWPEHDAYCPGEIYSPDNFSYRIFEEDDEVVKFVEGEYDGEYREAVFVPARDSVVVIVTDAESGTVKDSMHCDGTLNNIESLIGYAGRGEDMKPLDEYVPWHYTGDAVELMEKLEKAIDAVNELKKDFV